MIYKRLVGALLYLTCFILPSCKSENIMRKYDWIPTECAPEIFPVEIYSGTLYYGKDKMIYIPDGRTVNSGWGAEGSTHDAGEKMKEAPTALDINWISFAEKKSYAGHFSLDTKRIDELFQRGYEDAHLPEGRDEYNRIKVGLAPGGTVVVWISGAGNMVEVGRFQAKEVAGFDWKQKYPTMEISMKDFSDTVMKDLPDSVRLSITNNNIPYGLWDKWRKRFLWKVEGIGFGNTHEIKVDYFNKERQSIYHIQNILFENRSPVEKINVFWTDTLQREIRTEIKFDEDEVFNTFGQAGNEQATLLVTLDSKKDELLIRLKIKDKELPFKKFKFKSYYR